MKFVYILTLAVFCAAVTQSCGGAKRLASNTNEYVKLYTSRVTVKDTMYLHLPLIATEVISVDSISRIENDYAVSEVRIDSCGVVRHTLQTKTQDIPFEVEHIVERNDSIVEREKVVTVTEYKTKPLSWWQKTQITGFKALLLLTVALVVKNSSVFAAIAAGIKKLFQRR